YSGLGSLAGFPGTQEFITVELTQGLADLEHRNARLRRPDVVGDNAVETVQGKHLVPVDRDDRGCRPFEAMRIVHRGYTQIELETFVVKTPEILLGITPADVLWIWCVIQQIGHFPVVIVAGKGDHPPQECRIDAYIRLMVQFPF